MAMTADAPYYLVPSVRSRTAGRHVKHLPDPDADSETAPLCARERVVTATLKPRRPDDPILADWRLCRYCDPDHDHTPTGGSKDLNQLLAAEETRTLDDIRRKL